MSALVVPCSYCRASCRVTLADVYAKAREVTLLTFSCPSCDSLTELYMGSRRKRQGKRYKESEAKLKERKRRRVELSIMFADAAAAKMLAQDGCTCAERMSGIIRNGAFANYYGDQRRDGLCDVTHADGERGVPRHHGMCKLANSESEGELRAFLAADLRTMLDGVNA